MPATDGANETAAGNDPAPSFAKSAALSPSDFKLHVILVEPEIAFNTGSVGRTCVAAGAMLWLVRPLGFQISDRHIRRSGLDYWEHLAWRVVDSLDEVIAALGPDRLWSFSTKASRDYTDATFHPGDALIFGPESRGLPERWLTRCGDRALRIPIQKEARSLNLSNAVAVAVFEALRQQGGI
jgi:tRNA (cytidine/uridine-2'-O-)-methyltransferase